MWNISGVDPAAYIAFYPSCVTTYVDDTGVSDHPIRLFHGISDDYVQIGPCRDYFGRLKQSAKDVQMFEYPDTWHAFDYPSFPSTPMIVKNAQTTHCDLKEEPVGRIINNATQSDFKYTDDCVGRSPHVAYSASSTQSSEVAVKDLLRNVFSLK